MLLRELRARGCRGGISILKDHLATLKPVATPEPLIRFETEPASSSGSEQRHAQSFSGSDEVLIEGGERQFPALGEFQIGSVVQGEPVGRS